MLQLTPTLAGTPTGASILRQTTDQISSLLLLLHSIKPFSSKWKPIQHKLQEILSIITSLPPETQSSTGNTKLSTTIHSIQQTTLYSTNLAHKCIHRSFTGKLLMQSDLDITLVKFDNNLKCLYEFVNEDLIQLKGNHAIVVSRPGVKASRDEIKVYVNDLLCRFKIGSVEMKKEGLVSFNEVIEEDERCVKIAIEVDGFVNVLIRFLGSKEVGIQDEALKSVALICGVDLCRSVLVGNGVVGQLVRVLEGGSDLGKEMCVRCLMKVTANSDNAWAVSAHGGALALLKICGSGSSGGGGDGELVGLAFGVLRNLIGVDEIRRFVVEEGAIPMAIKFVRSKNEGSQIGAIEFVKVLASGNEFVRGLIVNEGGIRVLVRVLDPRSSYSSKARVKSMRALMILCSDSDGYMNSLRSYGFMDHVFYFLRSGDVSIQEASLQAACWLSASSDEFKKVMGDAGFMPELVKFLDVKSFEAREVAAETILRLVVVPRNQKRLMQNDQNVNLLLQLIDAEEGNSGYRKVLLSIIMSLTVCNEGRKKILSSGYLKILEKLADDQVLDAKKIVRNLQSSRIRSMIRGIWHP